MVTVLRASPDQHADEVSSETKRRRLDIQGLRAIALLAVIGCHAHLPGLRGGFVGVDVFFVISGYVITGSLVADARNRGAGAIASFYARRVRRILPGACCTLVGTIILTAWLLPKTRWLNVASDTLASSVYAVNWTLAARSLDYLAAEDAPSPLQHFWSLAVEEQFYLIWPACVVLGFYAAGALRRSQLWRSDFARPGGAPAALLVAGLIVLPSLVWSAALTVIEPARAYFVTTTRAWELALGAALAMLPISTAALGRRRAAALGWWGLALVIVSMVLITPGDGFPGLLAIAPTVGTAALLAASPEAGSAGPGRLLSVRPLTALGDRSYSLYLWHWPVLVVVSYSVDGLALLSGVVAVGLLAVMGWLSFALVERPVLRSRSLNASQRRTYALGAALTLLSAGSGVLLWHAVPASAPASAPTLGPTTRPTGSTGEADAPGAAVLVRHPEAGEPVDRVGAFTPSPGAASLDNPAVYARGCHQTQIADEARVCRFIYGAGRRIAIAGDSHAAQWVPALQRLARERGWELDSYTKTSCPVIDGTVKLPSAENHDACRRWNEHLAAALVESPPDLLLVSSTSYEMAGHPFAVTDRAKRAAFMTGLGQAWADLARAGLRVAVIRDTPRMGINVPECVAEHADTLTACAVDRAAAVPTNAPWRQAAAAAGVTAIDLTEDICPASRCVPVIGGVLVYRDSHHLTATYSATLSGPLADALPNL
jgi:peptidoglycan/LPS O-acetylase OafA/YrhL